MRPVQRVLLAVAIVGFAACASPASDPHTGGGADAGPGVADAAGEPTDADPIDPGGPADAAPPTTRHATADVPASSAWVDVGVDVAVTDTVVIAATGSIHYGATLIGDPNGDATLTYNVYNVTPTLRHASLIGKIGPSGAPFRVGTGVTFTAPVAGRLFLRVNDASVADNTEAFAATVDVTPGGILAAITPGSTSVTVSSITAWTDSGVNAIAFERLTFATTGTWFLSASLGVGADGSADPALRVHNVLPSTNHGVLMAKLGLDGTPFAIGTTSTIVAPHGGRLYLGCNDAGLENNHGTLATTVTVAAP